MSAEWRGSTLPALERIWRPHSDRRMNMGPARLINRTGSGEDRPHTLPEDPAHGTERAEGADGVMSRLSTVNDQRGDATPRWPSAKGVCLLLVNEPASTRTGNSQTPSGPTAT